MAYKLKASDENVLICEGACVVGDVTLARGVCVWYNAVLRGDEGEIMQFINRLFPIYCEAIEPTLEEVFVYELEVIGYDVKNILS